MRRVVLATAIALFSLTSHVSAGDVDPADLAFWQSIQTSTNPAEYLAYLDAFPTGKFAALARIRVTTPPLAAAQPATAAAPAATDTTDTTAAQPAAPTGNVGQGEKLVLDPPQLRVGQQTTVSCPGMPQPSNFDTIVVVKAGTPDVDPNSPAGAGIKVLSADYASNCMTGVLKFGPYAPGNYEIRF